MPEVQININKEQIDKSDNRKGDKNMKMNTVVDVLNAHGIKAELSSANKNGKIIPCVRFGEGRVTPTAYEPTWDTLNTEEEVVEFARKAIENTPEFNADEFFTKDYILKNVISCVRHQTNDDKTLRFSVYEDLEEYFRVPVAVKGEDFNGSIVVLNEHIKSLDIDPDQLRVAARDNLREHAVIQGMRDVLAQMMGAAFDEVPAMGEDFMYVGSVESRCHGASIMLLEDVLTDFCHEKGLKSLIIIPSSIHEVILISDEHEDAAINDMIEDVNTTQITDETEVLSDHLYRFEVR